MLATALLSLLLLQPPQPTQPPQPAPSTAPAPFPDALKGKWKGAIELPGGTSLEYIVTVSGPAAATIAIPQQGLPETALTDVAIDGAAMKFKLTIPGAPAAALPVFDLKLDPPPGASAAKGTMLQSGMTFNTTLKHLAEDEDTGPKRPQTPKPPFPYQTKEVSYESFDGAAINGTLTLPTVTQESANRGSPCVLFITGSGQQDRDETLFSHKPFAVIADALARAGVASLRVDDRGWAGAKDPAGKEATSETFARDTAAGVEFLIHQPEVDPARVGLIGHSEGGLIAPAVAAAHPESVSFIVLLAGPGVTGRDVLERQMVAIMKAQGATDEQVTKAAAHQRQTLTAIAAGDETAARASLRETLKEGDATGTLKDKALEDAVEMGMRQADSAWMRHFLTRDPREALRKVRCPVLVLNGGKDTQVVPAQNVPEVVKALLDGGNTAVTARVFPNLNHLFQNVGEKGTGGVDEYARIETTIDSEALEEVVSWTRKMANRK